MNKRFWLILITLIIILTGLGFLRVSSFKLKEQDAMANLQALQSPASVKFLQVISDYGKIINIGIPALMLFAGLAIKKKQQTRNALIVLLGMALSGIFVQGIKRAVKEPRPYEVDSRIAQWSDGGKNSFPSGHTAEVMAATLGFAFIFFNYRSVAILSAMWAILMMASRIILGVHNFTDIAGGIIVGCIGLFVVKSIFEKADKESLA